MDWASLVDQLTSLIHNYGIEILSSLILGYFGITSGFLAWVLKWVLDKGITALTNFLKRKAIKQDQKQIDKENGKDLQNAIDSPDSTESDVIQAGENLLNGSKKDTKNP